MEQGAQTPVPRPRITPRRYFVETGSYLSVPCSARSRKNQYQSPSVPPTYAFTSACSPELLEALCQEVSVGPQVLGMRHDEDLLVVKALKAVDEHRAISLIKHIAPDVDNPVGVYTQDIHIEGRVMESTNRPRGWRQLYRYRSATPWDGNVIVRT